MGVPFQLRRFFVHDGGIPDVEIAEIDWLLPFVTVLNFVRFNFAMSPGPSPSDSGKQDNSAKHQHPCHDRRGRFSTFAGRHGVDPTILLQTGQSGGRAQAGPSPRALGGSGGDKALDPTTGGC